MFCPVVFHLMRCDGKDTDKESSGHLWEGEDEQEARALRLPPFSLPLELAGSKTDIGRISSFCWRVVSGPKFSQLPQPQSEQGPAREVSPIWVTNC